MRGNATKGRTMDRTTCDAMRRVLTPAPPDATATTMEGIRLIKRVRRRRTNGYEEQALRQR